MLFGDIGINIRIQIQTVADARKIVDEDWKG